MVSVQTFNTARQIYCIFSPTLMIKQQEKDIDTSIKKSAATAKADKRFLKMPDELIGVNG